MAESNSGERKEYVPQQQLNSGQILCIIERMLIKINPVYGLKSARLVYLTHILALASNFDHNFDTATLALLSLLLNAGDFHYDCERVVERSSLSAEELKERHIYSYVYIKNLTSVHEKAKALLFYDTQYSAELAEKLPDMEYASLLFAASEILSMIDNTSGNYSEADFNSYVSSKYNRLYADTFRRIDADRKLSSALTVTEKQTEDGTEYFCEAVSLVEEFFYQLPFNNESTDQLFKLMIVIMDFKSTFTVWHTIHTAAYSVSLGKYYGLQEHDLNELFTGGVLHDIGKMAVPQQILESSGKLRPWEFKIMKSHVTWTERIIHDVVQESIVQIASRHHEKINGSGYPRGISGDELNMPQRVLAVADIFSALVDVRSYKAKFTPEQIMNIFKEMTMNGEVDSSLFRYISGCYDLLQLKQEVYSSYLALPLGQVLVDFQEELDLN